MQGCAQNADCCSGSCSIPQGAKTGTCIGQGAANGT
jgi:hypothetical protein